MSAGFWHYLGTFMLYTMAVIAVIYGAFWYIKKNGWAVGGWPQLLPTGLQSGKKSLPSSAEVATALAIESRLPLEARKNLYVVRSGEERFLIATTMETTQFLARLDNLPAGAALVTDSGESSSAPVEPKDVSSCLSDSVPTSPHKTLVDAIPAFSQLKQVFQQLRRRLNPAQP